MLEKAGGGRLPLRVKERPETIMDEKYFPEKIEEKWQKLWEESGAFEAEADAAREKRFYCLEMLPYPSGFLHMGHVRNYSIGDALVVVQALAGLQRAAPDRLGQLRPAGRAGRHQARRDARANGRRRTSSTCAGSSSAWASATTGGARSPRTRPSTTSGISGSS